jgi:cyclin C
MDLKSAALEAQATPARRSQRNSGTTTHSTPKQKVNSTPPQDFVGFFASLNVNMPLVATIAQEMLSFYVLCDRLKEDFNPSPGQVAANTRNAQTLGHGSRNSSMTPGDGSGDDQPKGGFEVSSFFLTQLLSRMRAQREADIAQGSGGRATAVNKVLERAQAAG